MGARINMENRQDALEHRLKLVEDALEELLEKGTKVHHVDLTEERDFTDRRNVKAEGTLKSSRNKPVTVKKKRKATAATT